MRRRELFAFGVALLGAAALSGCGYALVGTGRGILPENVDKVFVNPFVNDTTRVGLEQRLTDAVLRELSGRARLTPVASRGDAQVELSGKIMSYTLAPVRFDDQGRAVEYQISVVAKIALVDTKEDKILFEDPSFVFQQPYSVPATAAAYSDVENSSIEALARPFARSLVTAILEGF